ncbi:MAG: hypothetical protein JO090_10565, partial [Rhizobacter sp.]|nr:hypothetical protein [Rhizobacter sp.]
MHDARGATTDGNGDVADRWQRAGTGFLRGLLALPELALVAESCRAERSLHERLVADPERTVEPAELVAIADDDSRENYVTFLAFRDAVARAGTLEAHYLALVRGGQIALPPVFLDRMVEAIVAPLVEGADAFMKRAAQLLHRAQRVAVVDGRVLCADRERADRASDAAQAPDLVRDFLSGRDAAGELPILGAADASESTHAVDPYGWVLDLTHEVANDLGHGVTFTLARAHSGLTALARVLERWIFHFLAVRTTIRPLARIDDPAWRWHVGLDAEATALLNSLYRGEAADEERLERLIGLFRLDFTDPREMRADVAG